MKTSPALLALALLLTGPDAASAQDFLGGLARRAAETAAQAMVNRAVDRAPAGRAPVSGATAAPPVQSNATPPAADAAMPADFPAPHPLNFSAGLRNVDRLEFSEADKAAAHAFDEIGRYSCTACEGGESHDSWPRHEISGMTSEYALPNRLGALGVGEALRWTGSHTGTRYAITVTSERPIGQWPCKQLKWTGDRGEVHAERLGLICKPTANWHELL
ncbi:MAG: hypothetical protein EON90_09235 [Brevundimonas sp.]|nr:MAG: hypothetical protein EON90_09235 [Brevundimonas sp.]